MLPQGYFHLSNFAVKAPSAGSSCLIFSCLCLLLSSLPLSCWQDLIKVKVVLNLLCRVWACTSDSPFLPPECCDSQRVPACTASSGFQDWSQASFVFSLCWAASVQNPPFPLCIGGRLHFRGRNFRGVPWVSNKCLLLCRLLGQGWTLAFLLGVCSLGSCHVNSAFMDILPPPSVSLSPKILTSFQVDISHC